MLSSGGFKSIIFIVQMESKKTILDQFSSILCFFSTPKFEKNVTFLLPKNSNLYDIIKIYHRSVKIFEKLYQKYKKLIKIINF